jgi:acyl-coenzyme A thioesterase PaaI-like protein
MCPRPSRARPSACPVSFAAAAVGSDLRAAARVRRRGGRLVFVDVDVEDAGAQLVAHATAVYRLG